MNPAQLVDQFNRISEAPDAVPRLRRFILDLAVRGKLVEEDRMDEPASELLTRIRVEKARILRMGGMRKEKALPPLVEGSLPFRIPKNWSWSQLGEIGFLNPRNSAADDLPASFVPMPLISAEYGVACKHEVRPWGEIKSGYTHFAEGDVALAKITPCFENGKSAVFRGLSGGIGAGTTELHVVRPVFVSAECVLIHLKSPHFIESGIPRMTGTAGQKRLPTEYFANSPFPLPPLAEQHRIVAKVEELMELCDRLEAAQAERESRRDRFTAASLHRLNPPADAGGAAGFREQARFHISHLSRFTTRPDQVPALRRTILNLAIRGQLVRQEPNGIPVPALRRADTSTGFDVRVFSEAFASFTVPPHWSVEPLSRVAAEIVDCPHSTPKWTASGRICVRTNQFRPGFLDLSEVRFVSEETYSERIQRLRPVENDILYSREGGILGVACRVPASIQLCLGQRMMLIRAGATIDAAFLEMVLNSPFICDIARGNTTGAAAPRVNVATVRAYPIPLPPLAEQHRILAKVEILMSLCDHLEAQLTTAQTVSHGLLEAVLHEALASAA